MSKSRRVALYARVSSAGQRDRHTIDSQLTELPAAVARRGDEVVGIYVDDGLSAATGKLDQRPDFQRLLLDAADGKFDVIGVVDFDRISRSDDLTERGLILGTLQRAGVGILETSTGAVHDLDDAWGQQAVTMRAIFAAEENKKRRERSMRGQERMIAEGKKSHGVTPYGLAYDKAAGVFSIHPLEGPIVQEIYKRVATGDSCVEIALDLNEREVPPGRGRKNQAEGWSNGRVTHLVHSTTYRGEWVARRGAHLVVKVPPIVSEPLWYRAQDALLRWGKRGLVRTRHLYLCEGVGTCKLCSTSIGIMSAIARLNRPAWYRCLSRRAAMNGGEWCGLPNRKVAEVDEAVWSTVHDLLTGRGADLPALMAARHKSARQQAAAWEKDIATAEGILQRLDKAKKVILGNLRRGRLTAEEFEEELETIGREQNFARQQLETAQRARAVGQQGHKALDLAALRRATEKANSEQRRAIVRAVFPGGPYGIEIAPERVHMHFVITEETLPEVLGRGSPPRRSRETFTGVPLVTLELVA